MKISFVKYFKRIDFVILKAFTGPFLATFVLSMFLFLMQFLWKYIDDLVGKGIEGTILARLIFYSLADLLPMAMPLTVMVAGLMTLGNLSESFELVAMKSNGVSLRRILTPIFIFMIILAGINFYFMNVLIPRANLEAKALLYDVRQKKPAFNISEGVFYQQIEGYSIRVGKKESDNETIKDILIYEYKRDDSKRLNVIRAEKGLMKLSADKRSLYLTLNNGIRYDEMTGMKTYSKTFPYNITSFEKQQTTIDLSSLDLKFTEREAYKGDHRLMNLRELNREIDTFNMKKNGNEIQNKKFLSQVLHFRGLLDNYQINTSIVDTSGKRLTDPNILNSVDKNRRSETINNAINLTRTLRSTVDGLISTNKMEFDQIVDYYSERHKKFTLSVIVILLFLISAPLGAIIRKGGIGLPLVISVILFVLFYAVNLVGEKLGKAGTIPMWMGMWLSCVILLPLGIFITYKATRDSYSLSLEKYTKWIGKKIFQPLMEFLDGNYFIRKMRVAWYYRKKSGS